MIESQDISWRALNLSLAVYRLTDRFPAGEILISQLRELANGIGGDLVVGEYQNAAKKIDRLICYFKIAQAQDWVRRINWLILTNGYDLLKQEVIFKPVVVESRVEARKGTSVHYMSHNIQEGEKPARKVTAASDRLNARQREILQALKNRPAMKMSELFPLFKPGASERTLRNDLHSLVAQGLIKKQGINKNALYEAG